MLLLFSGSVFSQDEKGGFFLETGVKLTGGGDYLNFTGKTGISYNKNKTTYYFPDNYTSEYSHNSFSYSLAPRLGYQLDKLFSIGIDYQYFNKEVKDYMNYYNSTAGVFIRKNITTTKVRPYIEFSYGLGRSKEESYELSSGGGHYKQIEKRNLHYFAGAAGVAFPLNESFKLSFSAKIQNTIEKDIKQRDSVANDFRNSNIEVTPLMSVSYIIKRKNEK